MGFRSHELNFEIESSNHYQTKLQIAERKLAVAMDAMKEVADKLQKYIDFSGYAVEDCRDRLDEIVGEMEREIK